MAVLSFPENWEEKTILITGAGGFVGSWLAEHYLKLGATVLGVDNFVTGSESNIELLSTYKNFEFEKQNIVEKIPEFGGKRVDFFFNMASPASPIDFSVIPLEIMMTSSKGVQNGLEYCKRKGSRFLQASTSEVYGDPEIHPQPEDYRGSVNINGPRSCYDESKRFAETLCTVYRTSQGVNTRIVRIFNTYGPRMRANDGRVIPNFVNQALQGDDITIFGDGLQTRSFCFVSDLVECLHQVMFCDDPTPFNIGNSREYTIKECAEEIIKALDSPSRLVYRPLPKDDPKQRKPILDKIRGLSGYEAKVDLADGIKLTADYFKELDQK